MENNNIIKINLLKIINKMGILIPSKKLIILFLILIINYNLNKRKVSVHSNKNNLNRNISQYHWKVVKMLVHPHFNRKWRKESSREKENFLILRL
jgi:hypothetical protein